MRENQAGIASITNFWYEERGRAGDGRYARMQAAASGGKLGTVELQSVLASVALSRLNVQAVILEPETRTAFVARGKAPVAKGTWEKIDLSAWLRTPAPQ